MITAPDAISTTLQMLMALAVVVGALLVAFYVMKRLLKRDAGGSGSPLIRVIASQYIGIKKNIALVEVPGAVLVLGISNDRINLLTKIDDRSVLDGIKENSARHAVSFTDHLQRLTTRIKQVNRGE